jgi:hypothetical protein
MDPVAFLCFDGIDRVHNCGSPEIQLGTLATNIMSGFHIYLQSKKLWKPVLGETFVAEWGTGFTSPAGQRLSNIKPRGALDLQRWLQLHDQKRLNAS